MHVSAKSDYAVRAVLELAARSDDDAALIHADDIAHAQEIPAKFLEVILRDLRNAGLLTSKRGADGGYRLARPAASITIAEIIRAVDGPLAAVRGERPEDMDYPDHAESLREVWVATRAAVRGVLENVTVAQVLTGRLPASISRMLDKPGAWERRT